MSGSACGFENRERGKFCGGCGTLLVWSCPECGTDVSPTSKFCDTCGAVSPADSSGPIPDANISAGKRLSTSETGANRRQMSLLCCDLVDSSTLAHNLHLEDVRYPINNFPQISKEII